MTMATVPRFFPPTGPRIAHGGLRRQTSGVRGHHPVPHAKSGAAETPPNSDGRSLLRPGSRRWQSSVTASASRAHRAAVVRAGGADRGTASSSTPQSSHDSASGQRRRVGVPGQHDHGPPKRCKQASISRNLQTLRSWTIGGAIIIWPTIRGPVSASTGCRKMPDTVEVRVAATSADDPGTAERLNDYSAAAARSPRPLERTTIEPILEGAQPPLRSDDSSRLLERRNTDDEWCQGRIPPVSRRHDSPQPACRTGRGAQLLIAPRTPYSSSYSCVCSSLKFDPAGADRGP